METKCETTPSHINFGALAVSESVDMFLNINNVHPKSSAIFMIDPESVPSCLKISKLRGKIYPQSSEKLIVSFSSNEAKKFSGLAIMIQIRGA